MTSVVGAWGGTGIEQRGESPHEHEEQCGDCRSQGVIRGINGNGKMQLKSKKGNIPNVKKKVRKIK